MAKIIKRLLLFFISAFVFLSLGIFLLLNEPFVQHYLIKYANTNFFNKNGIELTVKQVSYSFINRTLVVDDIQLSDMEHPNVSHPLFAAQNISLKFNLLSSYLKSRVVIETLKTTNAQILIDYDANGKLVLPSVIFSSQNTQANAPIPKMADILQKYMNFLPESTTLADIYFQLGEKSSKNYQDFRIKKMTFFKMKKLFEDSYWIRISSNIQKSQFVFPSFQYPVNIDGLTAEGILYQNGTLEFSTLRIQSDIIHFESNLSAHLQNPINTSQYQLNIIKSEIFAEKFFGMFRLPSTGAIQVAGRLYQGENFQPEFSGEMNWQNLTLEGFQLYSGQGMIQYANKTFSYDNAEIITPLGGQLTASGKYEFFDEFYFENKGTVTSISLKELLDGVHAKQDVIDGNLQADGIKVTGRLFRKITEVQHDKYDVFINAFLDASNLHLIGLQNEKRKALPELALDLNIAISDQGLSFGKSKAYLLPSNFTKKSNMNHAVISQNEILKLQNENEGVIDVGNSRLSFSGKEVNMYMDLTGDKLNFSFLEHFLTKKTKGELNFTGIFTYNSSNPGIKFQSQVSIKDGIIDNIPFSEAKGNFALYSDRAEISNFKIITSVPQNSFVNLTYFSFRYRDMYSKITVDMNGSLANILQSVQNYIPDVFRDFDGNIISLNFNMTGFLLERKTWKLQLETQIQALRTRQGNVSNVSVDLRCEENECKKSKIFLEGFNTQTHTPTTEDSFIVVELYDVSLKKSNLAFELQNVPIEFFNYSELNITGDIYAQGQLQGTWQKPLGNMTANIDHTSVNKSDVGQTRLTFDSTNPENAEFKFSAFDNEVKLNLQIPIEKISQDSRLQLTFSNFDVGRILSPNMRLTQNIYSQLNAHFNFHGQWSPNLAKELTLFKTWSGSGVIENSNLQLFEAIFNLKTETDILFQNNILTLDKMILSANFGSFEINGNYNFSDTKIFLRSRIQLQMDKLNKTFYAISESAGKIEGELGVNGTINHPNFFGNLKIQASMLALRADTPPFTNVDGVVVLKDTIIEIQKFNAQKGAGHLSLTGTFDFKNFEDKTFVYPITNLHLVTKNAEFKIPIPVFRFLDLKLTTDLTVKGEHPPFLVAGQATIQRLSAFRDLTCGEIFVEYRNLPPKPEPDLSAVPWAKLNVGVQAANSISIQSDCLRGRFSTTDNTRIVGTTDSLLLDGGVSTESAIFSILKARFKVKKGEIIFSELQKFDPYIDIDMVARVASYDIYWEPSGRLSNAHLNLSAQPEYLPNGNPINTAAILFILTTGQVPNEDNLNNLLTTGTGVYSYLAANNNFSNVIDQTVSTVTGGLFDSLSIQPAAQNGDVSVRFSASRYFSQRLSFGVNGEVGRSVSTSSAFINYILNHNVSFTGAVSSSNMFQTGAIIYEAFGGLRFNFGTY